MTTPHTFNPPLMTRFVDKDTAQVAVIAIVSDRIVAAYKYPYLSHWVAYTLNDDGSHSPEDDGSDAMAIVMTDEIVAAVKAAQEVAK